MTGRERVWAMFEGREPDHLPLMPITMMFAADLAGVKYGQYAANFEVLAEAQTRVAETFGFDYVSAISDPAREAADCGAAIEWFEDQPPAVDESHALLQRPEDLIRLAVPDPLGGGRMHDRVKGVARLKERVGGERIVEGWVEGPVAEAADLADEVTLAIHQLQAVVAGVGHQQLIVADQHHIARAEEETQSAGGILGRRRAAVEEHRGVLLCRRAAGVRGVWADGNLANGDLQHAQRVPVWHGGQAHCRL